MTDRPQLRSLGSALSTVPPALILVLLVTGSCTRGEPGPRNLVFVSWDTVRRDHLPTYGYERETAPRLDSLAQKAFVFEDAFAQATNTNPSHASMFTGLYPPEHGVTTNREGHLSPDVPTLAAILGRSGFATGGFVSGVTVKHALTGLGRGFDTYEDDFDEPRRDGRITTEKAVRWLRELSEDARFFLFVHLYDAHGAYKPPEEYDDLFRSEDPGPQVQPIPGYQRRWLPGVGFVDNLGFYVDNYDEMIRYEDDLLKRLLRAVDLRESLVVVLSDHGETLNERYWNLDHGGHLFEEQIRIPLVLYTPDRKGRRVSGLVETVDLLPTLLELLGVRVPDTDWSGRDLGPVLRGRPFSGSRKTLAVAEAREERYADRGYEVQERREVWGLRQGRWKLILYPGREKEYVELYDLSADPGERHDLAIDRPEVRRSLRESLRKRIETDPSPGPTEELDPTLRKQLRSLGYSG